jgi:hypothetical protein
MKLMKVRFGVYAFGDEAPSIGMKFTKVRFGYMLLEMKLQCIGMKLIKVRFGVYASGDEVPST